MNSADGQKSPILQRDDRGAVTILTLNWPAKLNALSNELLLAIMRALDDIEIDSAIRVIVITGTGRAFSAGADIAGVQPHLERGPADAVAHFMRSGQQMTRRVESFPKPIIVKLPPRQSKAGVKSYGRGICRTKVNCGAPRSSR